MKSAPGRSWAALAAVLALASVLALWLPASWLDWQPDLAVHEPWRSFTAAFVHWSDQHLVANLFAAAVVGAYGWAAQVPRALTLAWLASWPLSHAMLLVRPELAHYGGLSGMLHGGVAITCLWLLTHDRGGRRVVGGLVTLGLFIKLTTETPWGPALQHPQEWDIAVVPLAHTTGALAGFVCGALALLLAPGSKGRPLPLVAAVTTERKSQLDTAAILTLIACCAIWGVSQVAAKVTLTQVPPLLQAGVRSLGAAVLLLAWSRWRGLQVWGADGTGRAGVLAGLMFAVEFACIFVGLQFTTASRMSVFLYLAPFVVALGMPFIARNERLTPLQVLGLVLAFGGVVWAFAEGFTRPAAGPRQWVGDALGFAGAVLWGATTLLTRATRLATALPEKTLLYQLLISGVALTAASALSSEVWPSHLSATVTATLGFQMAVVTFGSYLAWFWLVRHYVATRVAAFTLLTPLFGLMAGVALLNDPLTLRLLVALAAVCLGIALVNRATPVQQAKT